MASPAAAQSFLTWEEGEPVFHTSPRYYEEGYRGPRYRRNYDPYPDPYGAPSAPKKRNRKAYQAKPRARSNQSADVQSGGSRPHIAPKAPKIVAFPNSEAPGSVIIDTKARRLYYVISANSAYSYPISVGRSGFSWTGTEQVSRIASWPDWYPPAEMRQREPHLPKKMLGGVRNPLGAKAIYLGDTLYRIHGTNDVKTIGRAASSGCFRMMNAHVVHLASLIDVGTTVKVVKQWPPADNGVVTVKQPNGQS